jgi:1,4-alpha-glucan branching enzyme
MHNGNYVLVLHTHLPWVLHHGTWPHGVDWLTEAAAECYIPLLNVFNDLMNEGIRPGISIDISPILAEQLEHLDFKDIFEQYCKEKIAAAEKDEKDFTDWGYDPHHIYLATFWKNWYSERLNDFIHKYKGSIIKAFRQLQDEGAIEIMTCGVTHGYLPLLGSDNSVDLQVHAAKENYIKHFGREPRGIWLPECAYRPSYEWQSLIPIASFNQKQLRPGLEQILDKYNIEFFITDEPLIKRSSGIGAFNSYKNKDGFMHISNPEIWSHGVQFDKSPLDLFNVSSSEKIEYGTAVAFTRHHDISMQVWSGQIGYPAEPDYLDFHKKHFPSKLRYWSVTDSKIDMMYKTLYHPDWIWDKIDKQTNHFIHHIENTVNWHKNNTGRFATLTTPFDTELFGHWWFEGPEFLRSLLRGLHHSPYVNTAFASEQIDMMQPREVCSLPEGSWGVNNNHDVWINEDNKWTWEALYNNENRLKVYYEKYVHKNMDATIERIMLQALREFLLLQSSDWQFLIYTQSAKDYAEQRFSFHHSDFNKLLDIADKVYETNRLDDDDLHYLEATEQRNPPFQELKLDWWNH